VDLTEQQADLGRPHAAELREPALGSAAATLGGSLVGLSTVSS
jgi:hypothetical protein